MSAEETLSAMLDDEARDLELRQLLRDAHKHPELRQRWHREHMVRAVLHGETIHPLGAGDLAARVAAALDAEDEAPAKRSVGNWGRSLGGLGIAASVAALVLVGGTQLGGSGDAASARVGPLPVGVVNSVGAVPVQASYGTLSVPAARTLDSGAYRELARQRLLRYSQEHAEHAALNTPAGMVPFARVPVIEP